jgi:acyl-CoA hydrolase
MQPKIIAARDLDLSSLIRPGETVVVGQGTGEPLTLTEALVRQRHAISPMRVFLGAVFSATFTPEETDGIFFSGYGAIGAAARLAKSGRLDVVPAPYSRLPDLFDSGILPADVVLLQLSPPLEEGRMSLGANNDYLGAAARHARVVIAEINDQAPWTFGAELPADLAIDYLVETSRPTAELRSSRGGNVEESIAARVAALIPDCATLQIGIGAIPDAILGALAGHRELGIHSGMISDGIADLIEAGVATNSHKSFDRGITVAGVLFGTRRLNKFAHRNASLRLHLPAYTHGIDVLARIANFVAINSAIEVDLTGQVNAEVANGTYIGAVGGQVDFVRGANAAPNGRSIIALPATAKHGETSRVVATLRDAPVTSLRSDADLVVTEWGVAEMRGQTLAERARRMIAVAAPQFRESLERAARDILRGARS